MFDFYYDKLCAYELPHKLQNNLKLRIPGNWEALGKARLRQCPVSPHKQDPAHSSQKQPRNRYPEAVVHRKRNCGTGAFLPIPHNL